MWVPDGLPSLNQKGVAPGRVNLSEDDLPIDLAALQSLELAIGQALAEADRLGLSMIGISLCNALELLRQEHPSMTASDGAGSCH